MHDEEWAYMESKGMSKHKLTERNRRTAKLDERKIPVEDRPLGCIPTDPPKNREINLQYGTKSEETEDIRISERIQIKCPKQMLYLIKNIKVMDEEKLIQAVENEQMTLVSDGGLKRTGGSGWVAAADEEILAKCYGPVRGSEDQLSSFMIEITGMASATLFFSKIAMALDLKPEISLWSDNASLVGRLKNLCNIDPVAEHLKTTTTCTSSPRTQWPDFSSLKQVMSRDIKIKSTGPLLSLKK